MGLDNGWLVKSTKRKLTRADLPEGIRYPFSSDYNYDPEICYSRKWWGLRSELLAVIDWVYDEEFPDYYYIIEKPSEIFHVIEVVASWLDKERWETEGNSIWDYEEARSNLIDWIINLSIISGYMEENPDVYLVFYDSY